MKKLLWLLHQIISPMVHLPIHSVGRCLIIIKFGIQRCRFLSSNIDPFIYLSWEWFLERLEYLNFKTGLWTLYFVFSYEWVHFVLISFLQMFFASSTKFKKNKCIKFIVISINFMIIELFEFVIKNAKKKKIREIFLWLLEKISKWLFNFKIFFQKVSN